MTISASAPEPFNQNQKSVEDLAWEIEASQGKFTLILAHCNYRSLQEIMVGRIHQLCSVPIRNLKIEPGTTQLFAVLKDQVLPDPPLALMVFGLELVQDPEKLLAGMNQIREEFQKNCPFPMIVWVDDNLMKQFIRLAPDFESWATYTVFRVSDSSELLDQMNIRIKRLFNQVVESGGDVFLSNEEIFGPYYRGELKSALNYVRHHQLSLPEEIEAGVAFVQGRDAYVKDCIDEAIALHQKSLQFWQHHDRPIYAGAVLFYLGLCHRRQADLHRAERQHYWQEARLSFEQGIRKFDEGQRIDLVAKFIGQLGEILWRLEEWEDLRQVVDRSLKLHQHKKTPIQEARDQSLLAALKLQEGLPSEAQTLAQNGLDILDRVPEEKPWYEGLPLLLLGRSFRALGEMQKAIATLEQMKASDPEPDPQLYLEGLEELRSLYWQEQNYLEAFHTKQFQRSVEQQFRFIAFVGPGRLQPQRRIRPRLRLRGNDEPMAQEITSSGREPDIKELLKRIRDTQHKLIVIHGESGVGKSSLIQAGLLPALDGKISGYRDIITVYLDNYNNCNHAFRQVFTGFAQALCKQGIELPHVPDSIEELIAQLTANDQRNLLTIFIFDQFEEFFFGCPDIGHQAQFLRFLGQALNTPYVKVILSLREDYIHKLLICNDIEDFAAIGNDTLSKNSLYGLGNFSKETTQQVIKSLTENSQFQLPEPLITEIVNELTNDIGQVRPIELQIVGAQLQNDGIATLDQYQQVSKDHLVQKYLQDVIEDCGKDNQRMAEFVLYLLTDDQNTRPLKLRTELEASLKETQSKWTEKDDQQLRLALEILSLSGLVLLVPGDPQHYQLVHDYLVPYIRQRQSSRILHQLQEAEAAKLLAQQKFNQLIRRIFPISIAASIVLMAATATAFFFVRQALNREIEGISTASISLLKSSEDLEAMIQGIKGWKKMKENLFYKFFISTETKQKIQSAFLKVNYGVKQKNRIEGHEGVIRDLAFSPDGQRLATASWDQKVKLWNIDGELITTLTEPNQETTHEEAVYAVAFSPDGQMIATGDRDGVIKLWSSDGQLIQTFPHEKADADQVVSLAFSRNNKNTLLASASEDGKINVWTINGNSIIPVYPLKEKEERITAMDLSPNGQWIVYANGEREIKLWNLKDNSIKPLYQHDKKVMKIKFSPDEKMIASVSADKTGYLYDLESQNKEHLVGHEREITSLAFSFDSKIIATGSTDSTVKLWQVADGALLRTIRGETTDIWSLAFQPHSSHDSEDQLMLAIGSGDNSIKLWQLHTNLRRTILLGHTETIEGVVFDPTGDAMITGSRDGTVKRFKFQSQTIEEIGQHGEGDEKKIYKIDMSPNGKIIASAGKGKRVRLWHNLPNYRDVWEGFDAVVTSVQFNRDGSLIAAASEKGQIKILNLQTNQEQEIRHGSSVNAVAFHPDDQFLASGGDDGKLKLWQLNGDLITEFKAHDGSVFSVDFSGNLIATGGADGLVKLWRYDINHLTSLTEKNLIKSLTKKEDGHINWVNRVKFSPDGKLLASASDDSTIKLWNVEDPDNAYLVTTLSLHSYWVRDIDFSSDGRYLVSASADKTVVRWDLEAIANLNDPDLLLRQGCDWIRDYLSHNPNLSEEDQQICDGIESLPQPSPVVTASPEPDR